MDHRSDPRHCPGVPWPSALIASLLLAAPLGAQEAPGGWRIGVGGGVGVEVRGHDRADEGALGGAASLSVESAVGRNLWLGLEWTGAWLDGAFGGEHRHHLGATASLRPTGGPLSLRAGLGVGLATVVDVAGSPSEVHAGDLDVGIGDHGSVDLSVGLGLDIPVGSRIAVAPATDVLVQRAGGHTFVLGLLIGRVRVRLGS